MLIVSGGRGIAFESGYAGGYVAALGCAPTWSANSVASRRFAEVPSGIIAGFCLAAAVLSVRPHLAFETTVWPQTAGQWLAVLGLGLMPVGAAFYVWDIGVKRGDIQLLGVLSYGAPLLSTLLLMVAGCGVFSVKIGIATLLIISGAGLTSQPVIRRLIGRIVMPG